MKNKSLGSLKLGLSALSFQNMLSLASINIMFFFDRIMLAKLGKDYLNACVTAGSVCSIFIFGAIAMVGVADVFIGHYSGKNQWKKIGPLLWQMIWFSALVAIAFLFIALFGTSLLFSQADLTPLTESYFRWQMSTGCLPVLVAVLTSFFIGTGHFGYVLCGVIAANLVKIALQYPLIFGLENYFGGFGIKGAVIASTIANLLHIVILSVVMFNARNRALFGTGFFIVRKKLFQRCMKLVIPQSLGTIINYSTWAIVVSMLATAGEKHLMMYTIIDSFYILLGFSTEAMQKGVMYLAAHLIASKQREKIPQLLRNAVWLLLLILGVIGVPLLLFPHVITDNLDIGILSHREIYLASIVSWLYLSFEGITWILSGLLTALEGSFFVGPAYAMASVLFGVGGTYCLTNILGCDASVTCWVTVIYGLGYALLLMLRYKNLRFTRRPRFTEPVHS